MKISIVCSFEHISKPLVTPNIGRHENLHGHLFCFNRLDLQQSFFLVMSMLTAGYIIIIVIIIIRRHHHHHHRHHPTEHRTECALFFCAFFFFSWLVGFVVLDMCAICFRPLFGGSGFTSGTSLTMSISSFGPF